MTARALRLSWLLALPFFLGGHAQPLMAQSPGSTSKVPVGQALLQSLNTVRTRSCAGALPSPGGRPALILEPRLSATAAGLAAGQPLAAALKAANYVARRSAAISLRGHPSPQAQAEAAAQHSCVNLTDPAFKEVGFHARGHQVWMVLAEPFEPPRRDQADEVAAEVLARVNQARAVPRSCGEQAMAAAPPLRLNSRLNVTAQGHAEDMARHSYFSHTARDGTRVGARATRAGYVWQQTGENIAAGQMTARQAVEDWLKSPGHCVNLMRPQYTDMGLAYSVNLDSANSIYWVQVFGLPR